MNRLIVMCLLTVAVAAGWQIVAKSPVSPVAPANTSKDVDSVVPHAEVTPSVRSLPESTNFTAARSSSPSPAALEVQWKNRSESELRDGLADSARTADPLIKKGNSGPLTQAEIESLTREIRVQAAISREIARQKIAEIERKYP